MTRRLNARTLPPSGCNATEIDAWNALLSTSPVASAFLSYSYARAAQEAFGSVYVCIFGNERAEAFLPFCHASPMACYLGAGTPPGNSFSDYFGIIAEESFQLKPEDLLKACKLQTLLFTHLDETQLRFGLTGEQPETGLRIRRTPAGNFLSELAVRDKKFYQDTERRYKKFERDLGSLRFAVEPPDSETLDWLIETKIAQYRRTGKSRYPFQHSNDRAFLHALAKNTNDPLCLPRLTTLYCGNRRVAAHFGLQCQRNLAYWFPVYDTEFHSYSPGRLLLWETLKNADVLGIDCVDRGVGDTQAKRDFANESHEYLRGYYLRRTPRALLHRALKSLQWRLNQ